MLYGSSVLDDYSNSHRARGALHSLAVDCPLGARSKLLHAAGRCRRYPRMPACAPVTAPARLRAQRLRTLDNARREAQLLVKDETHERLLRLPRCAV